MRFLAATALLCVAVSQGLCDEVKLKVTGPDGLTGSATLVNTLKQDGSKYVRLSMKLVYGNGQTSDVLQESSYTQKGAPVRMLQTAKSSGKRTSVVVTFTAEGAQVVVDRGDGPKTNLVVNPEGSIENPTEFWFLRSVPSKGQVAEFFTFRMSEQAWTKAKTRYEGAREIVVAGKRVTAHLVQMGEVKSYVDDKGDPYRIELAGLTLERTGD